jgi:ABC-type nitrate/sulfonate/bicarbonate transport system ATPase subunit
MAQYVFSMNRVGKIVPPKRHILKNISLSFFPGAKIGVLGTNGSGKSTLLKIMAGIDTEIEGEATPMAGLQIGYLPQEPKLDDSHTVRESVESGMGKVFAAKARLFLAQPVAVIAFVGNARAPVQFQNPFGRVVQKVTVVGDGDHSAGVAAAVSTPPAREY